jgi:hypothetical protein
MGVGVVFKVDGANFDLRPSVIYCVLSPRLETFADFHFRVA